uniref:Membrane-spanning 4-domains subfamily A member 15-like n=1 Tax=Scleropages formosus TaxID=113540 RepID=A0A8C9VWE9_SCLFO
MEPVTDDSSRIEDIEPQATVTGTSKPLYRFFRGEPGSIGIVMLSLGTSQFLIGIPMKIDLLENSSQSYTQFWLGILFIATGILYILSAKSPSKKLVTASMAVSIVSIIATVLSFFEYLMSMWKMLRIDIYYPDYDIIYYNLTNEGDPWSAYHAEQLAAVEGVLLFYCFVGAVLLIVITAFARAGLRSVKTQAVVIMHNRPQQ